MSAEDPTTEQRAVTAQHIYYYQFVSTRLHEIL